METDTNINRRTEIHIDTNNKTCKTCTNIHASIHTVSILIENIRTTTYSNMNTGLILIVLELACICMVLCS